METNICEAVRSPGLAESVTWQTRERQHWQRGAVRAAPVSLPIDDRA